MREVNKILILFLVLLVIVITTAWNIVKSPYFVEMASSKVNELITKEFDAEVSFRGFDLSFIPLKTTLYDVRVKKFGQLSLKVSSLELKFTVWDLLRSDLNISKIELSDGYVIIKDDGKQEKKSELEIEKVKIFNLYETQIKSQIPFDIKELKLSEIDLQFDDKVYELNEFILRPFEYSIELAGKISRLQYQDIEIDSVLFDVDIDKNKIRVMNLSVNKASNSLTAIGEILQDSKLTFKAQVTHKGELEDFVFKKLKVVGSSENIIDIKGDIDEFSLIARGTINNLNSDYAIADNVEYKINYEKDILTLEKLIVDVNDGRVELLDKASLNLSSLDLSPPKLKLDNVHSHDLLYFLGDSFKIVKTRISGEAILEYEDEILRIKSFGAINLDNLSLGYQSKLLNFKKGSIYDTRIEIFEDLVNISSSLEIENSPIQISGYIDSEEINLNLYTKSFNIEKLGGEIGESVSGRGDFELDFIGPLNDVRIRSNNILVSDLNVLGYSIPDDTDAEVEYIFNEQKIDLTKITLPDELGIIFGHVNFGKKELELLFKVENMTTPMLPTVLEPHWRDVKIYLEKFQGVFNANVELKGQFSDLVLRSRITSNKMSIYNEVVDHLKADLQIANKIVGLKDIEVTKKKAKIMGELNVADGSLSNLVFRARSVELDNVDTFRKLGLNYRGVLNGDIKYQEIKGKAEGSGRLVLMRSQIGDKKIRPSIATFDLKDDQLLFDSSLLGDRVRINSKLFVGAKSNQMSQVTVDTFISDLKTILGVVSPKNIYSTSLGGDLKGNGKLRFRLDRPSEIDLDIDLSRMFLRFYDKQISLLEPGKISIKKSRIDLMKIKVGGTGGSFNLVGTGDSKVGYKIEQSFNLDLIYLSLFTDFFDQIGGSIFGRGILSGTIDNIKNYHEVNGRNIHFKLEKDIGSFTNGNFSSTLKNRVWNFNDINISFEGGQILGEGNADLKVGLPKLSFDYRLKDVSLKPIDNSSFLIDSTLKLSGERFPYLVNGVVNVRGGKVESELTDFQEKSKYLKSISKYINDDNDDSNELIVTDISVKTSENIHLKNRLADMFLGVDFKINGAINSPSFLGEITAVPDISKFKFKGNEFIIKNGRIILSDGTTSDSVSLNFESVADVADYLVRMKIFGGTDDLQINLESNPPLGQDDIFSLLTLGFTQDLSKNLESKDKTSITTISLGTMLVDQLKINEGLDSTLGLKLSVLPEFTESDDSPIEASRSDQQSKVKTATKLRVQKKITKDLDFTFSNTFGGDATQKQEMNLDFNLNNKWSIQGVFEKTNDPDEDGEENSAGADVKYKWSF